jgi:dihydroorotate dehydrogenase
MLNLYKLAYRKLMRPLLFRLDAQTAHERVIDLIGRLDSYPTLLRQLHTRLFPVIPTPIGPITLDSPIIIAAGLVKGHGFRQEALALEAVARGENIIPGWQSVPALCGPVEFGSFTRHPRIGNQGRVIWRDVHTRSTQNRIGLKNPGAIAAAEFLRSRPLPPQFGINIAVSPGLSDPAQEITEAVEAFEAFLQRGVRPTWFTLNLSCPNTEDDPGDHQTEGRTRDLCAKVIARLENTPLWVKIGPNLAESQYRTLMRVFHEVGVSAVIATNTLPMPTPEDSRVMAGVGGGNLAAHALRVTRFLTEEKRRHGYTIAIVGCGGVDHAPSFHTFRAYGAAAVQVWSLLVYEGLLGAALILAEIK